MNEEAKRGRGRPSNTEVFGDAAGDPLAQLVARVRTMLLLEGRHGSGAHIRVGVGTSATIRRRMVERAGHCHALRPRLDKSTPRTKNSDIDAVIGRLEAREERHRQQISAAKLRPKSPPHLKTNRETVTHEWGTQNVEVRNSVKLRLRKWQCMDGIHVDHFLRDFETCGADLRSRGFDLGSGGGGAGTPFPVRKVDAARRLVDLRKFLGPGQFDLVAAVLVYGATPAMLHRLGGEEHIVARREIRDAIDSMAVFYTPGRVRRKRTWDAASSIIEQAEREAAQ